MKTTLKLFIPCALNKIARLFLLVWISGIIGHYCIAAESFDDKRPNEHFCPITLQVMKDPVVVADGYSYERSAIERYFSNGVRSPMTGLPLPNKTLVGNQALKAMINDWTPNISAGASPLSSDADILAKRIREEFQRNAALLDSSKGRHIVAFLGNTGAGKSTLVNLLAGKDLIVSDDEEDYVLANPNDKTAMTIGRGGHSETVYPKFIDVENLRFFDLPGFNDTDGTERNLMNAAFIRKILLDAASVRLVFVAGQDQFTADRSASVRQLFESVKQLFVVDQGNMNLLDNGVFVATKVTCAPQAELTDFLAKKTDSRDKAALNQQLKLWSERNQLGRMFHPLREAQNKGVREQILGLIQGAKSAKVLGINVSVLYPPDTRTPLERLFLRAFKGAFDLKLQESPQTLSDYDRSLDMYTSDRFWPTFDGEVCQKEDAVRLLKEFCINPYHQAIKTFEQDNAGRLQKHIQNLRQERQQRVEYIEKSTEVRVRKVIASLVPPEEEGEYIFFDFAYHKDFYDQVCGQGSIQEISLDTPEQEVARRYYAGFISRHSHDQVMRWYQRFGGINALAQQTKALTLQNENLKKQLQSTQQNLAQRIAQEEQQRINALVASNQNIESLKRQLEAIQKEVAEVKQQSVSSVVPASSTSLLSTSAQIPSWLRGEDEAVYARFLKGALIYRPMRGSDEGMITLPIRELSNPLEGIFDLSRCGDTGKYLSISTGYRKGKKPENASKVEIWFAPRFLIEKEINTTAKHFQAIFPAQWNEGAPVGMVWTGGGWGDLSYMDYLTNESMDNLSKINLYENYKKACVSTVDRVDVLCDVSHDQVCWISCFVYELK